MITIYPPDCNDFSTNGLGILTPDECTVKEMAGGMYELTLVHSIDGDSLRWAQIARGCIIKAPVPMRESPLYELAAFEGTESTETTVTRTVYKVSTSSGARLRMRTGPGFDYSVLNSYEPGTEVIYLGASGSWYHVSLRNGGAVGYMHSSCLTRVGTIEETVTTTQPVTREGITVQPSRDQLFRVCSIETDTAEKTVTATAQHIFYDLRGNLVNEAYKPEKVRAYNVVQHIGEHLLNPNAFTLVAPDRLKRKISGDYSYKSPVEVLLDPEEGVAAQAKAMVVRDNYDVYLLPDKKRDMGVTIRRGKNLVGVSVNSDESDVVTRIIPVGKDKDGEDLLLEGDEPYVDSDYIDDYPVVYSRRINYDVKVVDEDADGETTFLTVAEARAKLSELAEADFSDGADLPVYGMEVDFVLLGDAEGYENYAALQSIHLYDTVTVIDSLIGLKAQVRVTGYEWDALTQQYTSVTLGDIQDMQQTVYSYMLPAGGISGTRIAPGSLDGSALRSLSLDYAAIAVATIRQLQADSIDAVSAHIEHLVAEHIDTDELYAALAVLATAQITTAHIEQAEIEWATIENLTAQIAQIAQAEIGNAEIDTAQIRDLTAQVATIALAQITTAHIRDANIDWAQISNLTAQIAQIATAQIGTASIQQAQIDWAQITSLTAQIASVAQAQIGQATITTAQISDLTAQIATVTSLAAQAGHFDFAHVRDLVADAMVLEQGVGGSVYIENLAATSAMLAQATLGELVLKGTDGKYYELLAEADGTLRTKQVTVTQGEIDAGQTASGRAIVETNANITNLNAKDIQAQSAVISQIMAKAVEAEKITAGQAFIAMASIPELAATAITALQGSLTISGDHVRIQSSGSGSSSLATVLDSLRGDATAAMQAVSGLGVGGVNLVDDSEKITISGAGAIEYADATCYRILNRALEAGRTYTLSMASATLVSGNAPGMSLDVWRRPASGSDALLFRRTLDFSGGHQKTTFTLPDDGSTYYVLVFAGIVNSSSGVTVELTKVKLEEGTFATTWTPSQADAEAPLIALRTTLETYPGGFGALVEHVTGELDGAAGDLYSFFRFYSDSSNVPHLEMGASDSRMKMDLTNSRLSFKMDGGEVAYFSDNKLYVTNVEAIERMSVGTPANGYLEMVTTDTGVGFLWRA